MKKINQLLFTSCKCISFEENNTTKQKINKIKNVKLSVTILNISQKPINAKKGKINKNNKQYFFKLIPF
jgi:hypothetical protein